MPIPPPLLPIAPNYIRYRQPNPFHFPSTYKPPPNASALLLYAYNQHILERNKSFCDVYINIKNNTVHNLSSYLLSDVEKTVLSLGLKFLPIDKNNKDTLMTSYLSSIRKLERKLKIGMYFKSNDYKPPSIPQNDNAIEWNPPSQPHDFLIHKYIQDVLTNLHKAFNNNHFIYTKHDELMHITLNNLKNNNSIIIKPADNNLGLTIINVSDYTFMCNKHLLDTNTYRPVLNYTPDSSYTALISILTTHNHYTELIYKKTTRTKLASSLLQLQNSPTLRIPPFYCIPKIHKTLIPPIPGRPIVSSISTMTYHTSVYLDMQFQPILAMLRTVCTSTNTIINDMHKLKFPLNSVILCADVTALYPNIPIELGITTVRNVLHTTKRFTESHLSFLMSLLHWVLTNNYCIFQHNIYLQIEGTAMGTPVATTYANLFLYGIETQILPIYRPVYYKRYIDDIFAIYSDKVQAKRFIRAFNNLVPTIKLEAVTIDRSGVMLDLSLKLNHNDNNEHDYVTHTLYQKPANIYQYIPYVSNHKSSVFTNFITQELCRFKLNCTYTHDYELCMNLFTERLVARGYDIDVITTCINDIPSRTELLTKLQHSLTHSDPPRKQQIIVTLIQPKTQRTINWTHIFKIPQYLKEHPYYQDAFKNIDITIGNKNTPSIGSYIIRSNSDVN